jgi:thiamine biosynthesis lipoprotein
MSQVGESLSTTSLLYCTRYPAMGTEYSLYIYARSREEADAIAEPVFREVTRVEHLLSNYRESSELSRINREAAHGAVTTDPETFRFLQTCFEWSATSQGAFDITVGKLMKTWGFFGAKGSIPLGEYLAEAHTQVGWQKVQLDETRRTVRFLSAGIELDPGGIGKGYAVDRAVKVLRERNISSALLSAGSSTIYALGAPAGKAGWKVQVPAPGEQDTTISTVTLRDTSLSTANRSEKYFIHDGHLYGAIMDPRTLRPVEGILQTTVISRSATDSDALSNALFVLGKKDRVCLLDQVQEDSALVILDNQTSVRHEITRWPAEIDNYRGGKPAQPMEIQNI